MVCDKCDGFAVGSSQPSVIVEDAAMGGSETVGEAVEGSKLVIRCLSLGAVIIAAIVMVRMGAFVLHVLGYRLKSI